jgi:hypothetical protein
VSVLLSGFPTQIDSKDARGYMSRARASYRCYDPGVGNNVMFFYRQAFAVYRTPPVIPARVTWFYSGWAADAASFSASITETGLIGTEVINGSVAAAGFTATITEIGTIGTSAIQALETYLATVTGVGIQGTDAINALEAFRASLVETGTASSDAISAIETYVAELASESAIGADTINGTAGDFYTAAISEVGESGSDAISAEIVEAHVEYSLGRLARPIIFAVPPRQIQRVTASIAENGEIGSSAMVCVLSFQADISESANSIGEERITGGRRNDRSRAAILHYLREVA